MMILLDNGLPRGAVPILTAHPFDVVHVGEIGLAAASDQTILDHAVLEGRIVVTLDSDFHTLLALSGAIAPSVMRIRVEGLKAPELASIIIRVMQMFSKELADGAAISVGARSARCRRLPLA